MRRVALFHMFADVFKAWLSVLEDWTVLSAASFHLLSYCTCKLWRAPLSFVRR